MPIGGVDDTFGFLLGEWCVQRAVTNHRQSVSGVFSGTVTVAPIEQTASTDLEIAEYREVGSLRMGAYQGVAHRRLRYLRQQNGVVVITFEDGRTFARCDLRAGRCDATHLCGNDRYDITWRVRTAQVVTEEWRARGPEKDYVASTVLRRVRPEVVRVA
ncbi:MAG: DUF6314 family protein [Actinomycetota bacterium]|jgi:hypothetical protein|nr:DUF6314 family protein [Actinomycetota bacterium]